MRTIHVLQAGPDYFIDGIFWGDDAEGVMLYLSAKGVSPDEIGLNIAKLLYAATYGYRQP